SQSGRGSAPGIGGWDAGEGCVVFSGPERICEVGDSSLFRRVTMLAGKRVKIPQWIHGQQCVVRVDVDAIIPDEDPSEPCFEPAAVKWMDRLQQLADDGD